MRMDWDAIKTGIKASIIASCCCSLPLALAFLAAATGVGSITAALHIAQYGEFFYALGTLFLLVSVYLTVKNRSRGTCSVGDVKKQWRIVAISILTYVIITITLIYGILPIVAQLLFN